MISSLSDIRNLESHEVLTATFALIAVVTPGVLTVAAYDIELLKALTTPKLLLVACSMTLPLTIFDACVVFFAFRNDADIQHRNYFVLWVASLFSAVSFYPALLAKFFFHFSRCSFLLSVISLNAALLTVLVIGSLGSKPDSAPRNSENKN